MLVWWQLRWAHMNIVGNITGRESSYTHQRKVCFEKAAPLGKKA